MSKVVNRRKRNEYNQIRLQGMMGEYAELDRIACTILAVCYSGQKSQNPKTQNLREMGCVAAIFVGNDIWVAANKGIDIGANEINTALGTVYDGADVYVVKNGDGSMHAEMQLLKELRDSGKNPRGMYMGVSKPCCAQCAKELSERGVEFMHEHKDKVKHWESPE